MVCILQWSFSSFPKEEFVLFHSFILEEANTYTTDVFVDGEGFSPPVSSTARNYIRWRDLIEIMENNDLYSWALWSCFHFHFVSKPALNKVLKKRKRTKWWFCYLAPEVLKTNCCNSRKGHSTPKQACEMDCMLLFLSSSASNYIQINVNIPIIFVILWN